MTRRGQLDIPKKAKGGTQQQEELKIGCVYIYTHILGPIIEENNFLALEDVES